MKYWKLITTVLFVLSLIIIQIIYWLNPILLTDVIKFHNELISLINHFSLIAAIIYILIFIFSIIFGIPISATIIGGYFFGIIYGIIYSMISIILGTTILCILVRFMWHDWIQKKYSDQLKPLNKQLKKYGLSYIVIIHSIPFMPSFPLNLALGISQISLFKIIFITAIGTMPLTIIYSIAGYYINKLASINHVLFYVVIFVSILVFLYLIIFAIKHFWLSKT
ncbi:hypothetical protein GF322_03085 [Candidatus Dependentiae bacterium]|nr:hypothetical protein [Candidatus Dependentiae bacterium]